MSSESNYGVYRKFVRKFISRAPCIPYLGNSFCSFFFFFFFGSFEIENKMNKGMYLKDLTFINDGNPKYVEDTHVNFEKCWLIYDLVI